MKFGNSYELEFSSGKKIYAFAGIIGLNPFEKFPTSYEGYDGTFGWDPTGETSRPTGLTSEERAELADTMIAAWQRFKKWDDGTSPSHDSPVE